VWVCGQTGDVGRVCGPGPLSQKRFSEFWLSIFQSMQKGK
jgi:hypothetical protein